MSRPDDLILWLGVGSFAGICLFIFALLAWFRLSHRASLRQATSTSAPLTRREIIWTVAPTSVFALAALPLLWRSYLQDTMPAADVTIIVTGNMWFWTYKYPDHGDFSFRAPMLAKAAPDLISPDAYDHIVVPAGETVRIIAVATKVIYSWTIPSIGANVQAVPGQTNQSWFRAENEGRYFGICSELCGLPHAFKPIEVEVVSRERFEQWVAGAKKRLTSLDASMPRRIAAQSEATQAR